MHDDFIDLMNILIYIRNNINGDIMNNYNQKIECNVKDCIHCIDGSTCNLSKIQIDKDIRNENTMYNTLCMSYEEEK